jgi:hypothetical protein
MNVRDEKFPVVKHNVEDRHLIDLDTDVRVLAQF